MVSRWLTPAQADIERAVIYTFHSVIAEGWRQGRLLLAGDAAHQTPPFLGQGMCAALRDAANLSWKLQAVLGGRAPDSLLDSYESERSPHVHEFIELAVRLGDQRFKAGQPEIFEFPSPRLGPGLLVGDKPAVGQPFPQPVLADGQLLDTVLGERFAVIGRQALLSSVTAATRQLWQQADVVLLPASDPGLSAWLDEQHVDAVVLRPDRYIMGMATSPKASNQ
jgi:3-(3-hydroxy-phenyl)propionate hydroxylase